MQSLDGKIILVTGGAKRIGRAVALELASRGAQAAVHYNGSEQAAKKTASECGGRAFQADLSQLAEIERLFAAVEKAYGRLDGLVNNAARYRAMDVLEVTEQDWDELHAVNVKAVFFCAQQAARLMKKGGGGRIVNISSLGGLRPWSKHVPYGAAKAGVVMMTRSLAKALAPEISVNSVAPGVIHFGEEIPADVQRLINATPKQRHGRAEEIAEAVAWFFTCSDFITGQTLAVDGGLSQRA